MFDGLLILSVLGIRPAKQAWFQQHLTARLSVNAVTKQHNSPAVRCRLQPTLYMHKSSGSKQLVYSSKDAGACCVDIRQRQVGAVNLVTHLFVSTTPATLSIFAVSLPATMKSASSLSMKSILTPKDCAMDWSVTLL